MNKIIILISAFFAALYLYPSEKIFDLMSTGELKTEEIKLDKILDENPLDYDTLVKLGVLCHTMANRDQKNYARKSVDYFEKAYSIKQEDYIKTYLGSAYTMLANETANPFEKLKYVNKGFKIMDDVIAHNPKDFASRLIRFYNSIDVPSFLNRNKVLMEDFQYLSNIYKYDEKLTSGQRARILLAEGEYFLIKHKYGDAINSWQTVVDSYTGATRVLVDEAKNKLSQYKNMTAR